MDDPIIRRTGKYTAVAKLIEKVPPAESRRLPVGRSLLISHLPNCCRLDKNRRPAREIRTPL